MIYAPKANARIPIRLVNNDNPIILSHIIRFLLLYSSLLLNMSDMKNPKIKPITRKAFVFVKQSLYISLSLSASEDIRFKNEVVKPVNIVRPNKSYRTQLMKPAKIPEIV